MARIIERTLWYQLGNEKKELTQEDLLTRTEPLIILGEAGMGKSSLLEWIANHAGYSLCTARQLINRTHPKTLLEDSQNLVIDALDEVSAKRSGDALDDVLDKLGQLDYPHFVLACRVADWRNATGLETIQEQYTEKPLALQLKHFDLEDALTFLKTALGAAHAQYVVEHFKMRGLDGLLGNPQTLDFIAKVAKTGKLPETRYQLFDEMIDILRVEHRSTKIYDQPAKPLGLDAVGAAFACIILTGKDAITRNTTQPDEELVLTEVSLLPGGGFIEEMMDTRLFTAKDADRFSYIHRRIGEFLGAKWLIKQADSPRKRRRLLSLFHCHGLVPASLRGLHASLTQDPMLWHEIIEADPMGVIEYGEIDNLTVEQAHYFLNVLERLAVQNPVFNEQHQYAVHCLSKPELLEELRRLITTPTTPFHLTYLILNSIHGTKISHNLETELKKITLDSKAIYALRSAALSALIESLETTQLTALFEHIKQDIDQDALRLAISLVRQLGFEHFDDPTIADIAVSYSQLDNAMAGAFLDWEKSLPDHRLSSILDQITREIKRFNEIKAPYRKHILNDFVYHLITRLVLIREIKAEILWSWVEQIQAYIGYERNIYERFDSIIQDNVNLRQAVQYHVLVELKRDINIHLKVAELTQRSHAFEPSEEDIIVLINRLNPDDTADESWRELIGLIHHNENKGAELRKAAQPFAAHSPELLDWLNNLAESQVPDWQIKKDEQRLQRKETEAKKHTERQKEYTENIEKLRNGDFNYLDGPAKAYLRFLGGLNENTPAHERIAEWLGDEIGQAAHEGFDVFLLQNPQIPTASDFGKIASENRLYNCGYIMVSALAERFRKKIGFDEVTDDRLMASYIHLYHHGCDTRADIHGLREAIETLIQERGLWHKILQYIIKPQLKANSESLKGIDLIAPPVAELIEHGVELASEWLLLYPDLSCGAESELIDLLLQFGKFDRLREIAPTRVGTVDKEKKRNWDAVRLIVDFESTKTHFEANPIERELIWYIRNRTGNRYRFETPIPLSPEQTGWIIHHFRKFWQVIDYDNGIKTGDSNPWDASEYILHLIRGLGNDISDKAGLILTDLSKQSEDSYSVSILIVLAEQTRKRVENQYKPPSLDTINAISWNIAPKSGADLQAYVVDELSIVQSKIKSDDIDSWRVFFDDQRDPYNEEVCRDHLIGLLRQGTDEIAYNPEVHVANDKRVDIACSVGGLRMPIEIKGQWHDKLWTAADMQLDAQYTDDWKADGRGIYLILWFGKTANKTKRLKSPGRQEKTPENTEELAHMLIDRSKSAKEGRVVVIVLDIER